jgi:tRNA(Ile)-lysidine synthase
VAHHRDDQVETVLMNLIRGTGLHGLTGMSPLQGRIIRPLLCVSRAEIEAWLQARGQQFVTDSSNLTDDVTRNKIRHHIVPMMESINPLASNNISLMASRLVEVEKTIESSIHKASVIDISELKAQPSPELVLYYQLKDEGFTPAQIEQIAENLDAESGRAFYSPTHQLVFHRGKLIVEPKTLPMKPLRIPEPGRYRINENHCIDVKDSGNVFISKSNNCITIDKAKIKYPLTIRLIENGDSFIPYGMTGKKLVSDFLTDIKCSLLEKRNQMVITDSEGQIVWLIGKRIDNRFRVTEQTTQVLQMTLTYS